MDFGENVETIFKAVPPIQELKDGFGYLGVLLRNTVTDQLQCHICGKWFKGLSNHIIQTHKLLSRDYKIKYGFALTLPLQSRSTLAKHSERARKEKSLEHLSKVRDLKKLSKGRRWWKKHGWENHFKKTESFKNLNGLCDEQMARRFLNVCDIVGKMASGRDLKKHDEPLLSAINRRGTLNQFKLKHNFGEIVEKKLYTDSSILNVLRKFYKDHKRVPCSTDFRNGNPSDVTIRNHFGSWRNAVELAGIPTMEGRYVGYHKWGKFWSQKQNVA